MSETPAQDLFGIDPGFTRNYNADVHKDCTPCPEAEGKKCDLIGTGIHQPIAVHLEREHGWSPDKIEGMRLGGLLSGKGDLEVLNLGHEAILLFQPARPAEHLPLTEDGYRRNAEECPACAPNLDKMPYPFICPGPTPEATEMKEQA